MTELKKSMSQKLRMDGRDYSRPGWYFVTLGADYHKQLFGAVDGGKMHLNALGQLVEKFWDEIPQHYRHIALGERQVMPNHFHAIIRIVRSGGKGLGEVINVFKGAVTREGRRLHSPSVVSRYSEKVSPPVQIWAPNYYDVICFDADELEIRENYIRANPRRWALRYIPTGTVKQSNYKGNLELLKTPCSRKALRISRRASETEISALQKELTTFDGIVCSTFLSKGERICLKALQASRTKIIWIVPMAMPQKIPVNWTNAFIEERALWISPFSDEQQDASRTSCEEANRLITLFCKTPGTDHTD